MKKTKARIISLILVVALIFTLLPDMSITAQADVTPVEPKRTTSCNFIFDYSHFPTHGAKPVDSYWNGTKETNDTNPLFFDDIVFPEKPVSNDGTEFLFYIVDSFKENGDFVEEFEYNPYTEYDKMTSYHILPDLQDSFLDDENTTYVFITVWADGTFSPKINTKNTKFQLLVLGETDFTYVFYKDKTYESNLPYDASGEYDNFYCLNTTGTMTTFYPAYLRLKPLFMFEESMLLSSGDIYSLGSAFGIDNPTALIASYNHSEHALTISVAETPIIFETNNYCKAPETLSVKVGDKITKPTDPSVTGYNFEGWYKDAEFKTAWDFEKDTVTSTKATHLYAKFSPMDVSVLFNANGGTVNDEAIYEAAAKYDAEYGTLPVPVREGYKFLGWAKDKAGKYMVTDKTIVKLAYDHMLYAIWEKDQTNPKPDDIVVKFDSNGGNSSADSMKIIPGENPGEMPKAEKKNVIFTGWYDKDGNKITDLSQVKEDTVLTAGWENITVVAKQKLSISENFIDAKNAYLAKRAANEGSSFNAKKVKFRYRIITDTEYLDTVSYNSIKFNKADCGKAKVNKNGLLTCKKSGLVAIKYQVREKVDGVNVWKDVEGSDVLFIAIEKAIKIKKAKTTLAVNESVSENRLVNYENAGAVGSNPNFATKSVVIQKPGVISYDETTGMFTALAPGKSKVTIMYKTIIGTKENGNPKYSTVKISFKLKVK